jgi:hypothetical protein
MKMNLNLETHHCVSLFFTGTFPNTNLTTATNDRAPKKFYFFVRNELVMNRSKSPQAFWPKHNTGEARNCQSQTATKKYLKFTTAKFQLFEDFFGGDDFVQS